MHKVSSPSSYCVSAVKRGRYTHERKAKNIIEVKRLKALTQKESDGNLSIHNKNCNGLQDNNVERNIRDTVEIVAADSSAELERPKFSYTAEEIETEKVIENFIEVHKTFDDQRLQDRIKLRKSTEEKYKVPASSTYPYCFLQCS